jgi:hypothetical protein
VANPLESNAWEFEKFALQRNDDVIRFSETKAALLFTLTGLLLGALADKIPLFKGLLQNQSCAIRIIAISSVASILVGIFLVAAFSLLAIFPRLKVAKETSCLYFGHLANFSEEETARKFATLDSDTKLNHILSQIHATSLIANRKFGLIRFALIGTVLVLLGTFLAIIALFIS